jgi:dihydroorotase
MTVLAIRGGHLIDPAAGVDALKDILLKDGRVAEIAGPGKLKLPEGAEVLDAKGLTVAPGLVDIHVHLREPGQGYRKPLPPARLRPPQAVLRLSPPCLTPAQ